MDTVRTDAIKICSGDFSRHHEVMPSIAQWNAPASDRLSFLFLAVLGVWAGWVLDWMSDCFPFHLLA